MWRRATLGPEARPLTGPSPHCWRRSHWARDRGQTKSGAGAVVGEIRGGRGRRCSCLASSGPDEVVGVVAGNLGAGGTAVDGPGPHLAGGSVAGRELRRGRAKLGARAVVGELRGQEGKRSSHPGNLGTDEVVGVAAVELGGKGPAVNGPEPHQAEVQLPGRELGAGQTHEWAQSLVRSGA